MTSQATTPKAGRIQRPADRNGGVGAPERPAMPAMPQFAGRSIRHAEAQGDGG